MVVDVVIVVDVEVSSSREHRSDTTDCILLLLLLGLPLLFLLSEKDYYRGSASWQDGKKGRQLALLIDSKSPQSVCAFVDWEDKGREWKKAVCVMNQQSWSLWFKSRETSSGLSRSVLHQIRAIWTDSFCLNSKETSGWIRFVFEGWSKAMGGAVYRSRGKIKVHQGTKVRISSGWNCGEEGN